MEIHLKSTDVTYTIDKDIGYVTFQNESNYSGLTMDNMADLAAVIEWIGLQEQVKVIVIQGNDKYFCSGGSMELLTTMQHLDYAGRREVLALSSSIILAIKRASAVVVGVIEGLAAGAGVDILLACDQTLFGSKAKLNFSYGRVNLIPDIGGLFLLKDRLGNQRSLKLFYESPNLSADGLISTGIAETIHSNPIGREDLEKIIRPILRNTKQVLAFAKHSLWAIQEQEYLRHLEEVAHCVCLLVDSGEHIAAVKRTKAMQKIVSATSS